MHERLSFYVKRDSFIHRLNPLTKLTLIFGLILISFLTPFYWTPHLIILMIVVPLSFIGKVSREYFSVALRLILPAAGFLFIMQTLFQPLEGKEIFHLWFLHPTYASMMFAFANATRIFVMVSSFTLFLLTTHPSELMSDLTRRGLPGQFAYVIISTLQILPQMQAKAQTIIAAQRSRGLDTESTFLNGRAPCCRWWVRLFLARWWKWKSARLPLRRAVLPPHARKHPCMIFQIPASIRYCAGFLSLWLFSLL